MISTILSPVLVEFYGFRIAGPAILVLPVFVSSSYLFISTLVWLFGYTGKCGKNGGIFLRRRRSDSLASPFTAPFNDKKPLLTHQLDEILKQELDLQMERVKIQRRMEDLPKQHEEREMKRQEVLKKRAQAIATSYGFGQPPKKLRSVVRRSIRMTRTEKRSARNQLALLCTILVGILFLLWNSLQ